MKTIILVTVSFIFAIAIAIGLSIAACEIYGDSEFFYTMNKLPFVCGIGTFIGAFIGSYFNRKNAWLSIFFGVILAIIFGSISFALWHYSWMLGI